MRFTWAPNVSYIVLLPTLLWLKVRCTSSSEPDAEDSSLIVSISSGSIRGFRVINPEAEAFLGIPFAKPPVGRLRFRKPEPLDLWPGVRNAMRFADACFQSIDPSKFVGDQMLNPRTNVSEDCLYLNVWVPVPRPTKAPVMVWLYGGSFAMGSTSMDMFNGKYLAAAEKVIVVTVAYRIGIFGFLYLGLESAPGNQGLHDQLMGLRWVRENIEKFGGDRDRVTLFGSGAGATSISLHLMSPLSSHLFHRAIIQGGCTGPPRVGLQTETAEEAKRRALLYAFEYLQCPRTDNPLNIIDCLKDMTPEDLINDQIFPYNSLIFRPCFDGTFLTRSPEDVMANGYFKKCPIIMGTVKNEGSWYVFQFAPEYLNLTHRTMTRDQFVVIMNRIYLYYPNYPIRTAQSLRNKLIALYTNPDDPENTDLNLAALDAVYTDSYFVCSQNEYARAYAGHGQDVYMFQLSQRYARNPWPKWMGVVHFDEVYFVFGAAPFPGLDLTAQEQLLSEAMMTYWANFARTG